MMKQLDLVKAFLDGATEGQAKSLSVDGTQLIHYNTAIAEHHEGKVILNYTRYSLATGKVQKMVTDTADPDKLVFVSGVPSDTRQSLAVFLNTAELGFQDEPDDWIMRIRHAKFGEGYVLVIDNGTMRCRFGSIDRTLLYPLVLETGLVEVVEDRR